MFKLSLTVNLLLALFTCHAMAEDTQVSKYAHCASKPMSHMNMSHGTENSMPQSLVINSSIDFESLMDQAMDIMNKGMANAPMSGDADHDFAAMMIPHHQGAVDMAKVELLCGKNPALKRLAQEIIVTQSSEIAVMQMHLQQTTTDNIKGHHHE